MRLYSHPAYPHDPATSIDVTAARSGDTLKLRYSLIGTISKIAIPTPVEPARADELWKHTCFEVFVRPPEGEAYCEFNFSPSGQWAAYRFRARRSGMANIAEPVIRVGSYAAGPDLVMMERSLDLSALPELPPGAPWRVALTTIVEQADGTKSYWSLAHPQGNPDFHHADNFALTLPAELP
jgi:hypothetical protein